MKAKGVPIAEVEVYTADNDPNSLLGRPHQYISKANWNDSRLQASGSFDISDGGGVETFSSATDLTARVKYVSAITQGAAIFAEYEYQSPAGLFFLRLSHVLTPTQAADYVNALKGTYPDLAQV